MHRIPRYVDCKENSSNITTTPTHHDPHDTLLVPHAAHSRLYLHWQLELSAAALLIVRHTSHDTGCR